MPTYENRSDGGYNFTDKRGRPWAIYPPGKAPTKSATVMNGVLPAGVEDVPLWKPSPTAFTGCLRLPSYSQAPWDQLVFGKDLPTITAQIEGFVEDPDLVVTGDRGSPLVIVLGLLLLWALDK